MNMFHCKASLLFSVALIISACGGGSSGSKPASSVGNSSAPSSSAPSSSAPSSISSSSASSLEAISLRTLADFPIGVAVSAANENFSIFAENASGTAHRTVIETHFSQMTAGNIMKMSYLHPAEDRYFFTDADTLVNYARDNGMTMHAHALVWHSDYQVPQWMKDYAGDQAAWVGIMDEHVTALAGHFAGRVKSWDVVNEAFAENGEYRDSLFYRKMGAQYIENAFVSARAADPEAELYYNDFNISSGGDKFKAVKAMAEDFLERDIPIDGIGFQMHIFMGWPTATNLRATFKQVVDLGLKVKLTELDIPLNNPYDGSYNYPNNYISVLTPALAQAQKVRFCEVVTAYLDVVPAELRGGITVWGVTDPSSWLMSSLFENKHDDWPLLFDADFNPKPALYGVADGLTGKPCL